jgi:hypothetical protein
MAILDQVDRLQILVIDRVVLTHQGERGLVMKVRSLPPHLLMRLGQQCDRFAPAVAATLSACDSPLCRRERMFCFAIPARVENARAVGERSERFDAEVYPGLLAGGR